VAKGKWGGGKIVAKPVRFYDEEATSIEGIDFKTTELSLTRGETTFNRFNLEEDHARFISTTRGGWIPRGTSSPSSGPFLTNPDSSEERRYYCRDVCIYIRYNQSSAVALRVTFSFASSTFFSTNAWRMLALILISSSLEGARLRFFRMEASLNSEAIPITISSACWAPSREAKN